MTRASLYASSAALLLMCAEPQVAHAQAPAANEQQAEAAAEAKFAAIEKGLHPQTGTVTIPGANARLELGTRYYFLPATEAKRVLTEAWGNPPDAVENTLGLVFPAGKTFHDATWGAVVEYQDTGHISDKDAASQNYGEVLSQMQSATEDANKEAASKGYPAQHLIGWAQAPTYDPAARTLIWARNIRFEGQAENTLNYDVRTLGRTGVLSLNMVDAMSNLPNVREAAKGLGATVKFGSGAGYADFNPSTDKLADYGLAGLVAAGAGLVLAKKAGLIAVILIFAKKAIALIIAAAVGGIAWFKRKFGAGANEPAFDEEPADQPE